MTRLIERMLRRAQPGRWWATAPPAVLARWWELTDAYNAGVFDGGIADSGMVLPLTRKGRSK